MKILKLRTTNFIKILIGETESLVDIADLSEIQFLYYLEVLKSSTINNYNLRKSNRNKSHIEPLGEEFEKILYENLPNLYEAD